jgi:hypothetical protein
MRRLRGNLTYANVMATIAVFMVLGGSAVAATQIPGASVGTKQLKKGAVTPSKLSGKTKGLLGQSSGPAGPEGPKGDRGPRGPEGAQGVAGEPGATGNEPFVVAAQGSVADVRGTSAVALSGTTSWTAAPGELGLLTGRYILRLAGIPTEEEECRVNVVIRDNGLDVTHFGAVRHGSTLQEASGTIEPVAIAVGEPGEHTITAASFGSSECAAGSELTSLHLVVAPLGR